MARNLQTSAIVDGIVRASVITGTLSIALIAPNVLKSVDPVTRKFLRSLDRRAREREIQRCLQYALRERLIIDEYQHGIVISKKGQRRLASRDYDTLAIEIPKNWDKSWRLVFFDIPATANVARNKLTKKLRRLGFQPLQQSIWIIPYACKAEVQFVTETLDITRYVTYIMTSHIDHEDKLIARFSL